MMHQRKLFEDPEIFTSPLDGSVGLSNHRILLIKGKYDSVMSKDQMEIIISMQPSAKLVVLPKSSHFQHLEEAEEFARAVTDFILEE